MSTMLKRPLEAPPRRPRRRRVGWVVAAVVLGIAAGGTVVVLANQAPVEPAQPPPPVVLPVPTPTVQAVERERATAFQMSLPDEVLAFAVAGQVEDLELLDAGATEAYVLTYTDGAREVTLRTSQWATLDEAVAAMARLEAAAVPSAAALERAAGPSDAAAPAGGEADAATVDTGAPVDVREEPVLVGGMEVGRLVISGRALEARAVWTNGATVFELRGPGEVVSVLYDAFGM
jgi:hypothetical protein